MMLIVASVASAQDKIFSYGVKAGLNMTSFVGKDADEANMKAGFHAGIVTEFRLGNVVAISPELLYSSQGAKMKPDSESGDKDGKLKYGYLNLPLIAKFYVTDNLSIDLGPQFGYRLSTKMTVGGVTIEDDMLDDFIKHKDIDISAVLGVTYNFGKVFAQARYNYGLTNVASEVKVRNSVLQLSVGYKF